MKKFLPYILILVAIVGLFTPLNNVRAQVKADCKVTAPNGKVKQIIPNQTYDQCANRSKPGNMDSYEWMGFGKSTTTKNSGYCYYLSSQGISSKPNVAETDCVTNYKGKWSKTPLQPGGPADKCLFGNVTLSNSNKDLCIFFGGTPTTKVGSGFCYVFYVESGVAVYKDATKAECPDSPTRKWSPVFFPASDSSKSSCLLSNINFPDMNKDICLLFGGTVSVNGVPITPQSSQDSKDTSYHLLQPIAGCTEGDKGCVCTGEDPDKICKLETFDPTGDARLGKYLNLIIKFIIGLSAVAAMVIIVVGGVEYMMSELISGKEAAKERVRSALLGLILALCSYIILFTINPDLLITDVGITPVTLDVTLQDFKVSAVQTGAVNGLPPISKSVVTGSEACQAAFAAEAITGVRAAVLLGIFLQESNSGGNTATASSDSPSACLRSGAKEKIRKILAAIPPPAGPRRPPVGVSAGLVRADGSCNGNGGAMGMMQILQDEWINMGGMGKNPWDINDAMVIAGRLLVRQKQYSSSSPAKEKQAICNYFGRCSFGGVNYGDSVWGYVNKYQQDINNGACKTYKKSRRGIISS